MLIERSQIAEALPGYEVGAEIGRGSHGLVFTARHRRNNVIRAVKVLAVSDGSPAASAQRFADETGGLTELTHPHIVRVLEAATHESLRLLVMEYLSGGTLTTRLDDEIDPERACAWGLAIADALQAAHERGVVHGDVQPNNVLFDAEGLLKVGDFGIAALREDNGSSPSAQYTAPELIHGHPAAAPSDLYALGVTLYRLLAGRTPFPANLPLPALIHHHLNEPPAPLTDVAPHVAEVVLRTLAKAPEDRYASVGAFADALSAAASADYGAEWPGRAGVPLRLARPVAAPVPDAQEWESAGDAPVEYLMFTLPETTARNTPLVPPAPHPPRPWTVPSASPAPTPLPSSPLSTPVPAGSGPPAVAGPPGSPIAAHASGPPVSTRPLSPSGPSHRGRNLAIALTSVGAVVILLLVLGFVGYRNFTGTDEPARKAAATSSPSPSPTTATRDSLFAMTDTSAARLLTGHTDLVFDLAFSPDGTRLASTGHDGTVRRWDTSTGAALGQALEPGGSRYLQAVTFTLDGSRLICEGRDGGLQFWDTATGQRSSVVTNSDQHGVYDLAYSADGSVLAVASGAGTVRLIDPAPAESRTPLTIGTEPVYSVAFDRDGRLATGDGKRTLQTWDADTGRRIGNPVTFADVVRAVSYSPDGKYLAASDEKTVRLYDAATWREIRRGLPDISALAFSPDGTVLVGAGLDALYLWDVRTGEQRRLPGFYQYAVRFAVTFSLDGSMLAASNDKEIVLYDLRS